MCAEVSNQQNAEVVGVVVRGPSAGRKCPHTERRRDVPASDRHSYTMAFVSACLGKQLNCLCVTLRLTFPFATRSIQSAQTIWPPCTPGNAFVKSVSICHWLTSRQKLIYYDDNPRPNVDTKPIHLKTVRYILSRGFDVRRTETGRSKLKVPMFG